LTPVQGHTFNKGSTSLLVVFSKSILFKKDTVQNPEIRIKRIPTRDLPAWWVYQNLTLQLRAYTTSTPDKRTKEWKDRRTDGFLTFWRRHKNYTIRNWMSTAASYSV